MADYVKKIKDLLALAESPNEHEARSALLKARQLMAKHKVSDMDIRDAKEQEVVRKHTGIDYSLRRDPWVNNLSSTIAEYHCCRAFQTRRKGKQVAEVGFIGFSDDVSVCTEVFTYAVDCIRSMTKKLRRVHSVQAADGYGFGFVLGLDEAYHKQQEEENWALVLVVPEAVNDAMKDMKKKKMDTASKLSAADASAFKAGIKDGHRFHEQKRINGGNDGKPVAAGMWTAGR